MCVHKEEDAIRGLRIPDLILFSQKHDLESYVPQVPKHASKVDRQFLINVRLHHLPANLIILCHSKICRSKKALEFEDYVIQAFQFREKAKAKREGDQVPIKNELLELL